MTEEAKDKRIVNEEDKVDNSPTQEEKPKTEEASSPAQLPATQPQSSQPNRPPQQGTGQPQGNRPPYRPSNAPSQRPAGSQPYNNQSRPPQSNQPRPQGAPRPPQSGPPRPVDNRPGQAPNNQGAPGNQGQGAPRPGQPQNRQNIDWLRSKPVPTGSRPPVQQRGLDLGRPDAWSGRQKPPTPGTPSSGPSTSGGPSRPSGPGQPYQGRPADGSRPYTPRPGGPPRPGGFGSPRPGGFGPPRPGGSRPGGFGAGRPGGFGSRPGGPSTTWGKETATSRRARSARKGGKEKEKPAVEEDADGRAKKRPDDASRAKGVAGVRLGVGKTVGLKGKLDSGAPDLGKAILVPHQLTVKDLSDVLSISSVEIIKELMKNGIMAPINQVIDFDTASIVASDLGFEIREADGEEEAEEAEAEAPDAAPKKLTVVDDDPSLLQPRPPVVTIMGHVDHGKTSLLDAIRRTNVAGGEFGGITQHIGAYQVEENGKKITFLDTPGHEAFTAMRARGAQVTDIAIVVVAADDGVQPQTLEAINHARAAGVPIVVALNKVDKENANQDHVKQQLSDAGLIPEDWGGNTVVVPVSAKKGTGVNDLLDMILLVSEMAALKANPNRQAVGTIIEAEMDKARGPLATVLVQNGTLNVGDYVVVGAISGKVRAMFNDKGKAIKKALPSTPASVLGLSDVPESGDILQVMPSEREAREHSDQEQDKLQREANISASPTMDLERLSSMIAAGAVKELDLVLKADVQGSLEPIVNSLNKLGNEKENIAVHLLHQATGQITEWDVSLAAAARAGGASKAAMVIGFNVEPDAAAKRTADALGIEIRTFKVIYDIIDAIEKAVKGLYEPKFGEVTDGHAEVRQVFKAGKTVEIAGSIVSDGSITRGAPVRVKRNEKVIFEGKVASLRRFKDDVRDVSAGFECGITLEGFNAFQEKDIVETYHKERIN